MLIFRGYTEISKIVFSPVVIPPRKGWGFKENGGKTDSLKLFFTRHLLFPPVFLPYAVKLVGINS